MLIWSSCIDLLRLGLFSLAHVCGGSLGGAIVVFSIIVRVALLPYTLRLAVRTRAHQQAVKALAPELALLQKRHADDSRQLAIATRALYASHGISILPKGTWTGMAVQTIVGGAVYRAVGSVARHAIGFLWVPDLTRPDAAVASIAAGLAGAATVVAGGGGAASRSAGALAAAVTFLVAWRLSAATGLYWVASNVIGVVQSLLVRRRLTRVTSPNG